MLRQALSRPPTLLRFSTTAFKRNLPLLSSSNASPVDRQTRSSDATDTSKNTVTTEDSQPSDATKDETTRTPSSPASSSAAPPDNLARAKEWIQRWAERTTIAARNRADDFTAKSKSTFSQFGAQLNKVTGYEEIEALKKGVVEQEEQINITRQAARKAKTAYAEAVNSRSKSQREVNDMLLRKSTWTESDMGRFTAVVRHDQLCEQEEARAKAAVDETENELDKEFSRLMRVILARYHEEQVWSDKIRSASTYGSLAALGLNMLVFILAILVVEPWKRRRLALTFEQKVEEMSRESEVRLGATMKLATEHNARQELVLEKLKEDVGAALDTMSKSLTISKDAAPEGTSQQQSPNVLQGSLLGSMKHLEMTMVAAGAFTLGLLSSILFR